MDTQPTPRQLERVPAVGRRATEAQRAYEGLPLPERARLLAALSETVEQEGPGLVSLGVRESHLPPARLGAEVMRAAAQFGHLAGEVAVAAFLDATIDLADRDRVPPRPDLRRTATGVGPVAVYAASNFPFAFGAMGTDTAAALAAGCAVIVKAHPLQPGTAEGSVEALRATVVKQGLPADLIQLVHGWEAGRELIRCPDIKAGAFTGSTAGGRALFDLANSRPDPIPFYGELGSVNPVLLTPAAVQRAAESLADELAQSITLSAGQMCTRPSLLLVPAGADGERFETALAAAMSAVAAGPMLSDQIADTFTAASQLLATHPGVRQLLGGETTQGTATPVLLSTPASVVLSDPSTYTTELFGPFALVVRYEGTSEVTELMEVLPGSLTLTLRGVVDDPDLTPDVVAAARRKAGRLLGAGVPTGVSVAHAQMHGGTWPAATSAAHSSVGTLSVSRFVRPVAYQDFADHLLPLELRDGNPLGIQRRVNGVWTSDPIRTR